MQNGKRIISSLLDGFEENPNMIASQLNVLRSHTDTYLDIIDQIANNNHLRVPKNNAETAKDMIRAAKKTILCHDDMYRIGKLSLESQREILKLVQEVLDGKREMVQFQLNRECTAIKEVFSKKVLK